MTTLCRLADLDTTGAKGVVLPDGTDVVVVAAGDEVRAYVNSCAHQAVPLEMFPDRFLDAERRHLVCTAHGARFRVEDGLCVYGPCIGKRLTPVAVRVSDGFVRMNP
jgi:nitrite reductase/ring-hydroxylating ferredoxin subunit